MIKKLEGLIKDIKDIENLMVQRLLYHGIPDKEKYNQGMMDLANMVLFQEEVKEKLEFFTLVKNMCNEVINGSFEDMMFNEGFEDPDMDGEERPEIDLHDYILSVLDMHHHYMTFSNEGLKRVELYEILAEDKREEYRKLLKSCYPEGGKHEKGILSELLENKTGWNRYLTTLENIITIKEFNDYMVEFKKDMVACVNAEALYNKVVNG